MNNIFKAAATGDIDNIKNALSVGIDRRTHRHD